MLDWIKTFYPPLAKLLAFLIEVSHCAVFGVHERARIWMTGAKSQKLTAKSPMPTANC
jgi:hypothetical protein